MADGPDLAREAADLGRAAHLLGSAARLDAPAHDDSGHTTGRTDALLHIHDAMDLRRRADGVLAAAVGAAREAGCSWQQVGEVLGTTRQAAFQRFGRPIDPRTGRVMDKKAPLDGADTLAVDLIGALSAGRWEAVHDRFDPTMAAALPPAALADTWATVMGMVGALESTGEPLSRRLGDLTIVDLPLAFEAGDMVGRLTFRADGRVSGFFVLEPGAVAQPGEQVGKAER